MPQPNVREEAGRRVCFYLALGLVTAATLMLQIIETRIISVISWYHLAFFIISIAMFGLTAGAVFVYLRRARFRPEQLCADLTVATLAFALTTDLAILVQLTLTTGASPSLTTFVAWTQFALCLAVPFFFSGVVVSLALTRSPYPVGKVYGVDLIGAAAGCLGVLAILNLTTGPSAVLWVGALIALAALVFARAGRGAPVQRRTPRARYSSDASRIANSEDARLESHAPSEDAPPEWGAPTNGAWLFRHRRGIVAGCVLLAVGNTLTDHGARPTNVKDQVETADKYAYERWNSFSRITVSQNVADAPSMFGASPHLPRSIIDLRSLLIDGGAGTAVYRFGGNLEELAFLRYDMTNLAYAVPGLKTGAVIGVGGGRDLLSARLLGSKRSWEWRSTRSSLTF